jgi:SOS-response transcriptional repressor LexA
LTKLINNPNSIFLKRAILHKKISDINNEDTGLLYIYESIKGEITKAQTTQFLKDNPSYNLELINKEYETTYPLLNSVNHYQYSNIVEHVAQYINLIDTWNKDQKTN